MLYQLNYWRIGNGLVDESLLVDQLQHNMGRQFRFKQSNYLFKGAKTACVLRVIEEQLVATATSFLSGFTNSLQKRLKIFLYGFRTILNPVNAPRTQYTSSSTLNGEECVFDLFATGCWKCKARKQSLQDCLRM